MDEPSLRYKTITDLSRILSLFEVQDGSERSVGDIAKSLSMLPSKVSRMLKTLEAEGFTEKNRHTGRYRIGARFLQLGLLYALNHPLRPIILPHLEQAAKDLSLLAAWGIFKNGRAIIVDRFRADNGPPIHLLGSDVPLHSSSYGKLFLAYAPAGEQERILKALVFAKLTPTTIASAGSMKEELRRVRKKGYAVDNGETREGIVGVAVPVFDDAEELVAALTVSGGDGDFSSDRVSEVGYLTERALFISRQLGYRMGRDLVVL
jgi:IclR family transcriptional regulator, KDG regulon repressor